MQNNRSRVAVNVGDTRRPRRAALFSPPVKLEVVPPPSIPITVVSLEKKEKLTGKHLGAKVGSVHDVVLTTKGERGLCAEFRLISQDGARMLMVVAIDEGHPMDAKVGDTISVDSIVAGLLDVTCTTKVLVAVMWLTEYFRRMSGNERYVPRPREMKRVKGK